jgi:phenylacetate-CoA ligase
MTGYNPFRRALYFSYESDDVGFTFGLFRNKHLYLYQSFEETKEVLLRYKPYIISMYPSYALDLGKHLTEEDIAYMDIKAISLNSEIILPKDKARISKIYKCPVYEEYSTVETGMIASSCKCGGMHIFTDNVVLEILDDNNNPVAPGERGEVVLTTLNSYAMPFIRYRIGDCASILPYMCACGSPFPLLGFIEGRNDDAFIMSDGTRIPAWKIYEIVERPLAISSNKQILYDFYIVQRDYNLADFYYVKGPDFKQTYINSLLAKSKDMFGPDFTLRINEVDNIERVKSVKRKYIHIAIEEK